MFSMRFLLIVRLGLAGMLAAGCSNDNISSSPADSDTNNGSDTTDSELSSEETFDVPGDDAPDVPDVPVDPWSDDDGDGIPLQFDNCPQAGNPGQEDGEGDGVGDICDNCPGTANHDQADHDEDGMGDVCEGGDSYDPESDRDFDGVADIDDNCVDLPNNGQGDVDNDGVGNDCDNCPDAANFDQTDSDDDGEGDACEAEPAGEICDTMESEFVEMIPNIYIVIDRSTSMSNRDGTGEPRIERAKQGLDLIAEEMHDEMRIGLSTYPCANQSVKCTEELNVELLPLGEYSEQAIKDSYWVSYTDDTCPHGSEVASVGLDCEVGGKHGTETGYALNDVFHRDLMYDDSDPLDAQRSRALVLITDGNSVGCTDAHQFALDAVDNLVDHGILVFVVGFNFESNKLEELAVAGGTDAPGPNSYFRADSAQELVEAMRDVRLAVGCNYRLDPQPTDAEKIWVSLNGEYVPEDPLDGFSYDADANVLTLNGQACDDLNAEGPGRLTLIIEMGCLIPCEEQVEVCDYLDNNCDGEVDEGCEGCYAEVCDGEDNDCDGEVDEGCPFCAAEGEDCAFDADCCTGECVSGTCANPCYPAGIVCRTNEDCCENTCVEQGSGQRTCVAQ